MSLSTLLIGFGFIGILATSFASVYFGQQRAVRSLAQRTEIMELRKTLAEKFRTSEICHCTINHAVAEEEAAESTFLFDPTLTDGSQTLMMKKIGGCKGGAPLLSEGQQLSSGLEVENISLSKLIPVSPGDRAQWTANWTVTFKRNSMAMSIPPLELAQRIALETTGVKPGFVAKCQGDEGPKPASLPAPGK